MLCRPFRAVFALIISYGNFDLPQNLFVDLADRRAECRHRARGVEIKDAEKILVFKVILRLHPAAGHEGVGDADHRGVFERHLDVVIIILLQVRIRNDAEDVAGMVAPVFRSKLGSDALELLRKAVFAGNAVITLQHGAHAVGMRVLLFAVEPLIRRVSACLVVRRVTSAPTQCGNCGGYPPYLCMGPSPRLHATVVGRTRPCLAGTPHSRNNFRSDDHCRGGHVLRRPPLP